MSCSSPSNLIQTRIHADFRCQMPIKILSFPIRNSQSEIRNFLAPLRFISQIPEPLSKMVSAGLPCNTRVRGGTLSVSQTLPPMTEPRPMVIRPRMVAPE